MVQKADELMAELEEALCAVEDRVSKHRTRVFLVIVLLSCRMQAETQCPVQRSPRCHRGLHSDSPVCLQALAPGDRNDGERERRFTEREMYIEAQKEKIRIARYRSPIVNLGNGCCMSGWRYFNNRRKCGGTGESPELKEVCRRQMAERDQKSEAIKEELQQLIQEMRDKDHVNQEAKDSVNRVSLTVLADGENRNNLECTWSDWIVPEAQILSSLEGFLASQDVDLRAYQGANLLFCFVLLSRECVFLPFNLTWPRGFAGSPFRIKDTLHDDSEKMLERAWRVEKSLEMWMKEQASRKARIEAAERELGARQSAMSVQQVSIEQRQQEVAPLALPNSHVGLGQLY
eukprot:1524797-Rhodomonas_salina.1